MTVPFETLGPGQVGRYAYQVIGKDGPIFNPTNISYLRPEDVGSTPIFDPRAALTGLAGLNLATSVGTLAISSIVLHEVRQMQGKLSEMDRKIDRVAFTLEDVHRRVQRIDARMSEAHLREALRHCVSKSISGGNVDLLCLTPLISDLQGIEETLEGGYLFDFGLRLSSDIRDHLQILLSFLSGIRRNVVCQYNSASVMQPEHCIRYNQYVDCFLPSTPFDIVDSAIAFGRTCDVFNGFLDVLGDAVVDQFLFAGDDDREKFRSLSIEKCFDLQISALHSMPLSSMAVNFSAALEQLEVDVSEEDSFSNAYDIFKVWARETDASLLFRLTAELEGIRDGYTEVFYPEAVNNPLLSVEMPVFALAATHEQR